MMKKLVPASFKRRIRLFQRAYHDWKNRHNLPQAVSKGRLDDAIQLSVQQSIKRTSLFENKVHNLQRAARELEQVIVYPGEVISFWNIIGNPSEKRGYKTGRNIVNGTLQEAIGGGLCQLSGIVYHTALLAGLNVLERYNHTVDIYKEEDRFTPLGADATVVYGYKDLRFQNNRSVPLQLSFMFGEESITCSIKSAEELPPRELHFERIEGNGYRLVYTKDPAGNTIAESRYKLEG
ncbi:MAG TPA: VanW family protein [Fluviicola sp.]|nr:VanW family protein [Fluviicola sp.]